MSDVFISYSRENKDFVRRLHAPRARLARAPGWIGRHPPSARWMDGIRRAIIDADAFLFVISPTSAASRTCAWEVSISAADNNKRVIPIVCVSSNPSKVPATIGALNWILATESDDFHVAVSKIAEAICPISNTFAATAAC